MSAEDTFFEGKILVEANLGRGFLGRGRPDGGGHSGGGRPRGHHRSGMGGGPGGPGMELAGDEGGPSNYGPSIQPSSMPPVALRLRLTNTSQETVEVTFILCKSELGDFAVRPEKLALAPGQTAEPEPMTSRLGLTTAELVLKVGLRMAGKGEQKELVLKAAAPADPNLSP